MANGSDRGVPAVAAAGVWPSFVRFWHRSYATDYIGFFVLLAGYFLTGLLEPFHRMFTVNDLRISFPHAEKERVPMSVDFAYSVFVPLILMAVYNLATRASVHKHHVSVLGLAIALVLTAFLTDLVKNLVGRPRPDLLARCKPAADAPRDVLVTVAVCTETAHHRLHDGWRSFPSGHSSFAFAGLGYLSLFLAGQLRIFAHGLPGGGGRGSGSGKHRAAANDYGADDANDAHDDNDDNDDRDRTEKLVRGDLGRALVCLLPLLGATWIAITRCQDYRHDVYDVCVGALLGWTVAYWSYRRYWPRLTRSRCHEPYPGPPAADAVAARYGRVRDEEEGGQGSSRVGSALALQRFPG